MRTWRVYEAYLASEQPPVTRVMAMALLVLVVVFVAGFCLGAYFVG